METSIYFCKFLLTFLENLSRLSQIYSHLPQFLPRPTLSFSSIEILSSCPLPSFSLMSTALKVSSFRSVYPESKYLMFLQSLLEAAIVLLLISSSVVIKKRTTCSIKNVYRSVFTTATAAATATTRITFYL